MSAPAHMPTPSPTPDEQAAYRAVLAAFGEGSSASLQLVLDGQAVAVPTGAVPLILEVLRRLAHGETVVIESLPRDREITFEEAADILNLAHRPFAVLVEKGKLRLPLHGSDNRVRLTDVLRYKAARHVMQELALQVLADEAQKHDLGY